VPLLQHVGQLKGQVGRQQKRITELKRHETPKQDQIGQALSSSAYVVEKLPLPTSARRSQHVLSITATGGPHVGLRALGAGSNRRKMERILRCETWRMHARGAGRVFEPHDRSLNDRLKHCLKDGCVPV